MGKILAYARTSTYEQQKGIESQKDSIQRSLTVQEKQNAEYYVDKSISGSVDDRPQFQELWEIIKSDKIEVEKVVVSELPRLSRNTSTLMQFMEDLFDREIGLQVTDGEFPSIDPDNPFLKAMAQMMAILAELQLGMTKMRTKRGVRKAAEEGKYTKKPPRGFTTDEDGYLIVHTEEYIRVCSAVESVLEGNSINASAKAAGIPQSTLSDIVNNDEKLRLYVEEDAYDEELQEALDEADVDNPLEEYEKTSS